MSIHMLGLNFDPLCLNSYSIAFGNKNKPSSKNLTKPRFGFMPNSVLAPISGFMAALERDKIKELLVSDVAAMVAPRTGIELGKRGLDAGRETAFREVTGTITNTMLAGWAGLAILIAMRSRQFNPLMMDYKAAIDSNMLEHFGNITKQILKQGEGKTADGLREAFLKKVLEQLKSTDNIATNHSVYKSSFSGNGKLLPQHLDYMIKRFMGKEVPVVESIVAERLASPLLKDSIQQAVSDAEAKFLNGKLYCEIQPDKKNGLLRIKKTVQNKTTNMHKLNLRKIVTQELRMKINEKPFLQNVYNYAIKTGKMSDEVYLTGTKNPRELGDLLKKLKYYMQEFLNRSLYETGAFSNNKTLSNKAIKSIHNHLFAERGKNIIQKYLLTHANDGLISYALKSKIWSVLLPVTFALGIATSIVSINNYMTKRKYGGKEFFPGEEIYRNNSAEGKL